VPKLADEIKMTKPFSVVEEEATLNVIRTAEVLTQGSVQVLKPLDLTAAQYNVLRILRGSEKHGLACGRIAERMVTKDPDVTRLLDRLETRGLIRRERGEEDRRVVVARIEPEGLALLKQIDPVLIAQHRRQFKHLSEKKTRQLIELLELVREE
jgi:DNA-binding MarR family transcriptional regulator